MLRPRPSVGPSSRRSLLLGRCYPGFSLAVASAVPLETLDCVPGERTAKRDLLKVQLKVRIGKDGNVSTTGPW